MVTVAVHRQAEEDLVQVMAGALSVLTPAGCALVGGHTCEGADLALGFSVTVRSVTPGYLA